MQHDEVRHAGLVRRVGLGVEHRPEARGREPQPEGPVVEADGVLDLLERVTVVLGLEQVANVVPQPVLVDLLDDVVDRVAEEEDAQEPDDPENEAEPDPDQSIEDAAPVEREDADEHVPEPGQDSETMSITVATILQTARTTHLPTLTITQRMTFTK